MVRIVYQLKSPVDLTKFAEDPFYNYCKTVLGDISTYTCKVLYLTAIKEVEVGSEVTIYVRHTHREVPKPDIDHWMALHGTLLNESRCAN